MRYIILNITVKTGKTTAQASELGPKNKASDILKAGQRQWLTLLLWTTRTIFLHCVPSSWHCLQTVLIRGLFIGASLVTTYKVYNTMWLLLVWCLLFGGLNPVPAACHWALGWLTVFDMICVCVCVVNRDYKQHNSVVYVYLSIGLRVWFGMISTGGWD